VVTARTVELSFPANSQYLVLARLGVAGIAPVAGLNAEQLTDLKLAVTELTANVVRHAYPEGAPGDVHVRLIVEEGALSVEVADSGAGMSSLPGTAWDPSMLDEQGMGLTIVRSVVDELEIGASPDGGTSVRFRKLLSVA
jgi:anti-sigma regulatory factor (Ser/Thr protein kinase)